MSIVRNLTRNSKGGDTSPTFRRHPWPARHPTNGPLFDARFHRLIDHLCSLWPRPIGEVLLQLAGTQDDARVSLVVLLERYGQLDAGVVEAVGGDVFPPAPLHEVRG